MIDFRRMKELIRKEDHMKMAIARERAKAERITAALSNDGGGGGGTAHHPGSKTVRSHSPSCRRNTSRSPKSWKPSGRN